jgi:hypothetical protein
MGDPSLGKYASKYKIICLKLDEVNHDEIRKKLPFCKVVFIPYFSKPTWKEIGKLDCEANAERNKIGVDVNSLWKALYVIGVAPWKATFFCKYQYWRYQSYRFYLQRKFRTYYQRY